MTPGSESRSDAVTELVKVLRDQVSSHAEHIADLESRLSAANQRIAEQQRLLTRLLERGVGGQPPEPLPPALSHSVMPARDLRPPAVERERVRPQRPVEPAPRSPRIVPTPLEQPVAFVRTSEPAVADRARVPSGKPVRLKVLGDSAVAPRIEAIDAIAGAVLQARPRVIADEFGPDRRIPLAIAVPPTSGVVRAAHSSVPISPYESTLTLDRQNLERGHRALSRRRRWFPFGRR
jgi:hypothetical protein